jgi:hypothetical protein
MATFNNKKKKKLSVVTKKNKVTGANPNSKVLVIVTAQSKMAVYCSNRVFATKYTLKK